MSIHENVGTPDSDESMPFAVSFEAKLKRAICGGDLNEVNAILKSSDDASKVAFESLPYVAKSGKVEMLRVMLTHVKEEQEPRFYTGLMGAANSTNEATLECAKVLLDAKADPNFIGKGGMTALMYAARNNRLDIAKLLFENGANTEVRDMDGWTAMFHAVEQNCFEVGEFLKMMGARDDVCDSINRSPYHIAAHKGFENFCTMLTKPTLSEDEKYYSHISQFLTMPDEPLADLKSGYQTLAFQLLLEIGAGVYLQKFKDANITLYELLNISEERLKEIGILIKEKRTDILNGIRAFQLEEFKPDNLSKSQEEKLKIQHIVSALTKITKRHNLTKARLLSAQNNAAVTESVENVPESVQQMRERMNDIAERSRSIYRLYEAREIRETRIAREKAKQLLTLV